MKNILLTLISAVSFSAFANEMTIQSQDDSNERVECVVRGYRFSVRTNTKLVRDFARARFSEVEASEAAEQACRLKGYRGCRLLGCSNLVVPN